MTRTWTRGVTVTLGVVLAVVVTAAVVLALLLLPVWLVDQAGPRLEGAELTKAVTEERRTILAVLAAIGAAVTLWYTHQRQELDRDANRTDRYTKAVEQLGDDTKPSVQLGGVYALERVAIDSRRDRAVSIEVLSAFVRQQSKAKAEAAGPDAAADDEWTPSQVPTSDLAGRAQLSEPVFAAVSVLARRPPGDDTYPAPNLTGANLTGLNLSPRANLAGADLTGADLTGANLSGANLTDAKLTFAMLPDAHLTDANLTYASMSGADLTDAKLPDANLTFAMLAGADLTGANMPGANLPDANLHGADLPDAMLAGANLTGAYLHGANLTGADLTGADLTGADLTGSDLTDVRYDNSTTWPDGFTPPPSRG